MGMCVKFRNFRALLLLALLAHFAVSGTAQAAEVDNFTTSGLTEIDSTPLLNRLFNDELDALIAQWTGVADPVPFTLAYIQAIDRTPVLNRITRRFIEAGGKIQTVSKPVIYADSPCYTSATLWVRPLAGIIFLNGIPVGTDKVGHFHDGGSAIFRKVYFDHKSLNEVLGWAARAEHGLLGYEVANVYSNADLAANYEGFRFYRGLFFRDEQTGQAPILSVVDGKVVKNREVDLADYVTSYWNEAMNPSRTSACMERHFMKVLPTRCDQFFAHPEWYLPRGEKALELRYENLRFRPSSRFRMDHICTPEASGAGR